MAGVLDRKTDVMPPCEPDSLLDVSRVLHHGGVERDTPLLARIWRSLDIAALIVFRPGSPVLPLQGTGLSGAPDGVGPLRRDFLAGGAVGVNVARGSDRLYCDQVAVDRAVKRIPLLW
jgi:hypothetical protein